MSLYFAGVHDEIIPACLHSVLINTVEEKGGRRELNPQPQDPQSCALTKLSYAHHDFHQ